MWNFATVKCLVFILTLPGFLARIWDYEYMDRRNERPPFRGLPDILRELYHKHSQNVPPNRHIATVKRGDRYSINDLIAYLKGMVGSDEIYHTGRSTYVRWGAGG